MAAEFSWANSQLAFDVDYGFLNSSRLAPRQQHPQVILNNERDTVLRTLRTELARSTDFTFSVAFVSPRAIALLKQELIDFSGQGRIITSDYLSFNSPRAFAELLHLHKQLGVDVRIHKSNAFHPKGYIFHHTDAVTAMVGSSNMTENALVRNHEWNLKVSAASGSDLASQFAELVKREVEESTPLSQDWIDDYSSRYTPPPSRPRRDSDRSALESLVAERLITPNAMQREALLSLAQLRQDGKSRAIIISATGTGKTILSALDVRACAPRRMLFVVHREQILDRAMDEFHKVLGGPRADYGKLSGNAKQFDRRYLFATVQTLSNPEVLSKLARDAFDYVIFDEAHRVAASGHRKVLEHFTPRFLLGMTATPERGDGVNVFEFFDFNVAYEIRLNRALEENMLAPFHYYGVADVTLENGVQVDDNASLSVLISPERVGHVIHALELYGQAGVPPRGLIFCSRKDEAHALSHALNERKLRGRPLRTLALTGDDSLAYREQMVERLEAGELDYLLTVDIFNEGVDIPSVNQVVMLRQTQSSIVFVQQLGRGLRKSRGKEYLVVIDFIGNYANNYLIPIALFGDQTLNKESLRKNLISAEETGVLPGLSSVRFDRISQQRVLASIASNKLDSTTTLRLALRSMRDRLGRTPLLEDFFRFDSVDPVILATSGIHYPGVLKRLLSVDHSLSEPEEAMLRLLTHEVLPAKRIHEYVLIDALRDAGSLSMEGATQALAQAGLDAPSRAVDAAIDTLRVSGFTQQDQAKFTHAIVETQSTGAIALAPDFASSLATRPEFAAAVDDLLRTGRALTEARYDTTRAFTPGRMYSRRDAARLLGWPRNVASTIYGYKTDTESDACAIFVTLHKPEDVAASTAYEDEILDRSHMRWFSKSKRTLSSPDVAPIVRNDVEIHVFAQRDGAEGSDHYYLGQARSISPEQSTMPGNNGETLSVVQMILQFDAPMDAALYDYFHPELTA
ncbi:DEAD/DEAH box helicase [Microbacterium sp. JZ101]